MLEYQLTHGAVKEKANWLKQLRDKGQLKRLPGHDASDAEGTTDEPLLLPGTHEIWNAFIALSGQRVYGQHGPNAIQYSEIKSWSELNLVNKYDRPFLTNVIVKLDHVYTEHAYAELKKAREKQSSNAQRNASRRGR